jgi:site-specific DNA-cytosine methylase
VNYYNEFDPFAAAWLRELIKAGHIPDGDVDERDMRDVQASELLGYTQWHFFAGIGGWSRALSLAGWPNDRPVLTGSPPCQPFSNAGKQQGVKDDRHLAPHFLELVAALRPPVVFGEQVAAAVKKDNWLDDLLDDLELNGYSCGAIILPAAAVGAPHIRQRLWFYGQLNEKVSPVWADEVSGRIRERFTMFDGTQKRVPDMPKQSSQEAVLRKISPGQTATEESCKRGGICEREEAQAYSHLFGIRSKKESKKEEYPLYSGPTYGCFDFENKTDEVRTHGDSLEDGGRHTGLRLDKHGQGVARSRVYDRKYQNSLLGDKCGSRDMGAKQSNGNIQEDKGVKSDEYRATDIPDEVVINYNPKRESNTQDSGVGAPHIRQRLWFTAKRLGDSSSTGLPERVGDRRVQREAMGTCQGQTTECGGDVGRMGCTERHGPTHAPATGWDNPDWLYCRDGKWRPVEPIHVEMVDGLPGCVGYLRDENTEKTQEEVNACLSCVWKKACPKEVQQWCSGVTVNAEAKKVLQPTVHGTGDAERPVQQHKPQQKQINEKDEVVLRGLREQWQTTRPPSGQRSSEQLRLELDDVVCLLPPSSSFAEFQCDRATSIALQTLCKTLCEAGTVQYPPVSIQEVWSSLGEETKNRLRMGFDASRWKFVVPFPLEHNSVNRVGRLRGYGNAIVPQVAEMIIREMMIATP